MVSTTTLFVGVSCLTLIEIRNVIISGDKQHASACPLPLVSLRMEHLFMEACSHQLSLHLRVFTWFRAKVQGGSSRVHSIDHFTDWSHGASSEHAYSAYRRARPMDPLC